jgi:arylsulfatase A-like enzyme
MSKITILNFVCLLLLSLGTKSAHGEGQAAFARPINVVLFLVDDLGWTDVACFGSDLHQTPHIDRLARRGVCFTQAYAPAPSCSPARAGIMTGQFPGRLGMTAIVEKQRGDRAPDDAPLLPATTKPCLPDEETTIAEVLRQAGYATGLVGKWHLGDWQHDPRQHGFDVAVGAPHAGAPKSYFWPAWEANPRLPGRFEGDYLTDRLTEEACRFVEANRQTPFFLTLSFHSVHVPIEAKQDKVTAYQERLQARGNTIARHTNPHYAAMVESMDEGVGRVLHTLDTLGLADRTMVIFFSDNGGLVHRSHRGEHTPATSNHPLRSGKGFLYEGGIRVPLILSGPGVARTGGVCTLPVHGCDLFPTICRAAGIDVASLDHADRLDGRDLQGLLRHPDSVQTERPLFWHYPHFSTMGGRPSGAIRLGDWKLLEHFETGRVELYNLDRDTGETSDLSQTHPGKRDRLHRLLKQWRDDMGVLLPSRPNPQFKGNK